MGAAPEGAEIVRLSKEHSELTQRCIGSFKISDAGSCGHVAPVHERCGILRGGLSAPHGKERDWFGRLPAVNLICRTPQAQIPGDPQNKSLLRLPG